VQDDVLFMPWNTLDYDPTRVWALDHANPAKAGRDLSRWFYTCDRKAHAGTPWAHCYGCYQWHHQLGGRSVERIHGNLSAQERAVKAANTGREDGLSCDLTDAFYIPGARARDFARLCALFADAGTAVELALTTIMDTLAPRAAQQRMRHVNSVRRDTWDSTLAPWRALEGDPLQLLDWFHPLKLSGADARAFLAGELARAQAQRLFTRPDLPRLRVRPPVSVGHL
jgi:hypothetical protein